MFHFAVNFGNLANVANTAVNALNDDVLNIQNSRHVPNEPLDLIAQYAFGDELLRARDTTPSIAQLMNSYVSGLINSATIPDWAVVQDLRDNPTRRRQGEGISYTVTNSGAGPTDTYVYQWLQQQRQPAPAGQIYTMRGTSTTAAVANTWTTIVVTWEPSLVEGLYAVVGGIVYGATELAFSCIFPNQFYRPGGLAHVTEGMNPWPIQRRGGLGQWGLFTVQSMPLIRVLNTTTVNAHTVYLDVVRIR